MEFICKVCDRSIIERESEYKEYLTILCNKNYEILYKRYTFNNFNLDEVDKILNDYVTIHNENFYFYLICCEFVIEFDNSFTANIETFCFHNIDISILRRYLLHDI